MTNRPLSKAEVDQALARALRLEELQGESISLDRATQVAAELGITPASWQSAVEGVRAEAARRKAPYLFGVWRAPAILALFTFGFGALWSVLKGPDTPGVNWDVPATIGLVAIALGLGIWRVRRNQLTQYLRDLTGYWAGFPFGFAVGFGNDALWFSLTGWTLSALIAFITSRHPQRAPTVDHQHGAP